MKILLLLNFIFPLVLAVLAGAAVLLTTSPGDTLAGISREGIAIFVSFSFLFLGLMVCNTKRKRNF